MKTQQQVDAAIASSVAVSSEVNRDTIVASIKANGGFKAPKLVSLDKDWSGFSFRYTG